MLGRTLFAFVLLMIGASALVPLSLPHLGDEHDASGVAAVAAVPAGCADCGRKDVVSASCPYACTAGFALVITLRVVEPGPWQVDASYPDASAGRAGMAARSPAPEAAVDLSDRRRA